MQIQVLMQEPQVVEYGVVASIMKPVVPVSSEKMQMKTTCTTANTLSFDDANGESDARGGGKNETMAGAGAAAAAAAVAW